MTRLLIIDDRRDRTVCLPARTNMPDMILLSEITNTIIPFLVGLACGIPVGAALVIVWSAAMLSSQRSRQEEAEGSE